MAAKQRGRAGDAPPARLNTEYQRAPANPVPMPRGPLTSGAGPETLSDKTREDTKSMSTHGLQVQHQPAQAEGVTVIGEAVRRVLPERAEFLVEITATAATAAQALRDNQTKTAQVTQTVVGLGVQQADVQTISLNIGNAYTPAMQALPPYGGLPPQTGQGAFPIQPDVQFGSYQARHTLRMSVREPGRAGEILDTVARAGASAVSPFSFKAADEASARRAALEAAGKDARAKAETLAAAAGRQIGEAMAISEDIVASNGTYAALRSSFPFAFGAGAPPVAGELEYYARVSASFRFQA